MDYIFITDLKVDTIIGIYDWERETLQRVSVDLELGTDARAAARTESVDDTLNYKTLSKSVEHFIAGSRFRLVETLAERLAERILEEFDVPWLRLRLHKPGALSNARDVGIVIERSAADPAGKGSAA